MQEIAKKNYKTAAYNDVNLESIFDPETAHQRSFIFRNSVVASPHSTDRGKLYVTFYALPPKQTNYPYHYHTGMEEAFYIISGTAILKSPEGESEVKEGDVIVMPANKNGAHQLYNPSETETVHYLDIDTASAPEVVFFPETGKFRIFTPEHSESFLLKDKVNYLDQE
jgi:uncharacterized cupin superfamily protein